MFMRQNFYIKAEWLWINKLLLTLFLLIASNDLVSAELPLERRAELFEDGFQKADVNWFFQDSSFLNDWRTCFLSDLLSEYEPIACLFFHDGNTKSGYVSYAVLRKKANERKSNEEFIIVGTPKGNGRHIGEIPVEDIDALTDFVWSSVSKSGYYAQMRNLFAGSNRSVFVLTGEPIKGGFVKGLHIFEAINPPPRGVAEQIEERFRILLEKYTEYKANDTRSATTPTRPRGG